MEKLNILGTVVEISDSLVEYNKVRKSFSEEAFSVSNSFRGKYTEYGNYEVFIENFERDVLALLKRTATYCIKTLVDYYGVLEVDEERFFNDNGYVITPLADAINEINGKFDEVDDALHNNEAARGARKEGRGRYTGGGFGLGAAIEASAKAGALNMATGAAHSIFNSIGNGIDRMKASSRKKDIYNSQETVNTLCRGIYNSVFSCHIALIRYLAKFNIDRRAYDGMIKDDARKSAQVILNNVNKISDNDRCRAALIDALKKDPYQPEWYMTALARLGDADGTLEVVAKYFGWDGIEIQKTMLVAEFAKSLSLDTEAEALRSRDKIMGFKEKLHYSGRVAVDDEIDAKIKYFDEQARTADGILFDTRDEANIARNESALIHEKLQSLDDDIDSILALRTSIEQMKTKKLVEKYSKILNDRMFTVFTENHPLDTEKKALCAKEDMRLFKEKIGFSGKIGIEDKIELSISNFDKKARTVDGIMFNTRAEADVAREEYNIIRKCFLLNDKHDLDELKKARDVIMGLKCEQLTKKYIKIVESRIKQRTYEIEHPEEILRKQKELEKKLMKEKIESILENIMSGIVGAAIVIYAIYYIFLK